MPPIKFKINGVEKTLDVDTSTPVLWVLRDHLHLTGSKYGCGVASCGACTILFRNAAVRSCQLPIAAIANSEITTIEGLSKNGDHPLQQAWIEHDVAQCGYCQTGQIMSAAALLKRNPKPSDKEIEDAMQGNICRCGTYLRIKAAIKSASEKI